MTSSCCGFAAARDGTPSLGTWLGDLQRAVNATTERVGTLHAAFANVGVSTGGVLLGGDGSEAAWRDMILTNVLGVALTARATLPELVKVRGHLLITGSVTGNVAPSQGLYSATKWAVRGRTESWRKTVSPYGVRVTLISPGRVDTSFWNGRPTSDFPTLHAEDVARGVLFALARPPTWT